VRIKSCFPGMRHCGNFKVHKNRLVTVYSKYNYLTQKKTKTPQSFVLFICIKYALNKSKTLFLTSKKKKKLHLIFKF
jgi:predicted GTPase